uniref:F-box domain-containing protein n=1 Tax=Panagrellus redivivus TaxID=6233 RepID=A0A7E4VF18_PANRE
MATAVLNCELMRELVHVVDKTMAKKNLEPSSTLYQLALSGTMAYHSVLNYASKSMFINTKDYDLSFDWYSNNTHIRPILSLFYLKYVGTVNFWRYDHNVRLTTERLANFMRDMPALHTLNIKNEVVRSRELLTMLANDSRIRVLEILAYSFCAFRKDQLIKFANLDELHLNGNLSCVNIKQFEKETFPVLRKIIVKDTFLSKCGVHRLLSFIEQQAATVETIHVFENKKPSRLPLAKHLSHIGDLVDALGTIAFKKRVEIVFEANRKKSEVESWVGNGFQHCGDYYVQHHRFGQGHLWYYVKK